MGATMEDDLPDTLKKIAAIGYKDLSSAFSMKSGFYGMSAKEFAKVTGDLGLSWVSQHIGGKPFKMPAGGLNE